MQLVDGTWKEIERFEKPIEQDSIEQPDSPSETNPGSLETPVTGQNGTALNGSVTDPKPENGNVNGNLPESINDVTVKSENNTSVAAKVRFLLFALSNVLKNLKTNFLKQYLAKILCKKIIWVVKTLK